MRVRWAIGRCNWVLAAFLALGLAACGPPELPRLGPDARLLAFGDSLTHGVGAAADQSYPAVLAERLDREVVRSGEPGERSDAARKRLPRVLDRVEPDLVVLCHGGNDILDGRDPAAIRAALEAMVRTIQQRGIPVVLIGVPAKGELGGTAALYYEVAQATGVPLEDEALETIIADASLKSDPVHPNAAGYRKLARGVHRLLIETGAVAEPG